MLAPTLVHIGRRASIQDEKVPTLALILVPTQYYRSTHWTVVVGLYVHKYIVISV